MRQNTKIIKRASVPTKKKDTRNSIEKFSDLAAFDFKTAAVIGRFIHNGCLFCELTHLCSEGRKRVVLEDSDDGFRECCKDFSLSIPRCEKAITCYIKDHPEQKDEVISC